MKKILFIHHATTWGGAPLNMINIINSLDKNIFEIEVLLLKEDSIVCHKLIDNNIKYSIASSWFFRKFYSYLPHTVTGFIQWYQLKRFFFCWLSWFFSHFIFSKKELRRIEYDIVHLNSSVLTDWLKPCSKKGKVIIHIQEPLTKGYFGARHRFFTNQMRKYANHIIAISNDNAQRVNIPIKTTVVYNYTNVGDYNELDIEKYSSKSVLYLGGAARIKGFYPMVNALDYLDKNVKIYFAGSYVAGRSSKNIIKRIIKFVICYRKKKNRY